MTTALIVCVCLGALVGISVLTAVCVCAGRRFEAAPADCAIVLGAHVWMDGRMSNALTHRCEAALDAWQRGQVRALIVCGGQGGNEPMPEAEAMRAFLRSRGVPEAALFIDDTSVNTRENMANARAIMEAQGFATALICTSDYHLTRALWIARDAGVNAVGGLPSPSPEDLKSLVISRVRETCSWILYGMRKL